MHVNHVSLRFETIAPHILKHMVRVTLGRMFMRTLAGETQSEGACISLPPRVTLTGQAIELEVAYAIDHFLLSWRGPGQARRKWSIA